MAGKDGKRRENRSDQEPESAFDLWLKRGLHQLFDDVASEPIPEELLRLIEGDRGEKQEPKDESRDPDTGA